MSRTERYSFIIIIVILVIVGAMGLTTPLITVLFSYFALCKLNWKGPKWLALVTFGLLVAVVSFGFFHFFKEAMVALPKAATASIPALIQAAKEHNLELPFSDWDSLKAIAMESMREQLRYLGNFAKVASKLAALMILGVVIACTIFLSKRVVLDGDLQSVPNNLYTLTAAQVVTRFRTFYHCFATVMGAQLVISAINTVLTGIFVLSIHLPNAWLVIAATFLFGLLPIIGNLISNTIVVGMAFLISAKMAGIALIFLVVLHKLEYFLNSKIIGDRIRNPVWLTMIGLILGERLMGIPGMILAPVILYYIKVEASQIPVLPEQLKK